MSAAGPGLISRLESRPISAPAPSLQGDPEKLPDPRRQVEGGNLAGHDEEPQAEPGHDVADGPQARLGDRVDEDAGARRRSRLHSPPPATQK